MEGSGTSLKGVVEIDGAAVFRVGGVREAALALPRFNSIPSWFARVAMSVAFESWLVTPWLALLVARPCPADGSVADEDAFEMAVVEGG